VRVLIADDDPELRAILCTVLRDEGHDVVDVATGTEAIRILWDAEEGVVPVLDVVVLDVCMPELSGLGVLGEMRLLGLAIPTVVVTGFPHVSVDVLATKFGAMRVLHKPLQLSDVCEAVRAASEYDPTAAPIDYDDFVD